MAVADSPVVGRAINSRGLSEGRVGENPRRKDQNTLSCGKRRYPWEDLPRKAKKHARARPLGTDAARGKVCVAAETRGGSHEGVGGNARGQ